MTLEKKFIEFRDRISRKVKNFPIAINVILFSNLIKKFQKQYNTAYQEALKLMDKKELVSKNIIKKQINRTKSHMGIKGDFYLKKIAKRTIATYAAEGIIFDLLSRTKNFPNCIWLNMQEVDQRTIIITNCLRKKRGLDNLPMIFL